MYGLISIVVLLTDQATKYLVMSRLPLGTENTVIPHFFRIVSVRNPGIVFGLFSRNHARGHQLVIIIFTIVAMVAILVYSERKKRAHSPEFYPLALILGGAAGNLLDRLFHGRVVDFLDFFIQDHHWPAFNVADSGIVVGVTLLLILQWVEEKKQKRETVGQ